MSKSVCVFIFNQRLIATHINFLRLGGPPVGPSPRIVLTFPPIYEAYKTTLMLFKFAVGENVSA